MGAEWWLIVIPPQGTVTQLGGVVTEKVLPF